MALTSALRSRPPVPIAWTTPPPSLSMIVVTSCIPVPEAPTMPILPGFTTLVNAIGTPEIMPVPQSGPINNNPLSCAFCLSLTSSSNGMLSVKENTFNPLSSAFSMSPAAYSPGMENSAKFASGIWANAASMLVTLSMAVLFLFTAKSLKNFSASLRTVSIILLSSVSTTITISLGAALPASAVSSPPLLRISLFASVPIIMEHFAIPAIVLIEFVSNIRLIES